jgi:hypothetical protein
MNERTQEEKETFGKVNFTEAFDSSKDSLFNDSKIDKLIEIYIIELKLPNELIVKTVERSRDRFLREYNKLEA